jgi:hypothetical protein
MRLFVLVLSIALLSSGACRAEPAGRVTRVQGVAEAVSGAVVRALRPDMVIAVGEVLRTGPDARLEFRLLDDSLLTLGGSASLTVDEMVHDPTAGTGKGAIRLLEGAFLVATGAIGKTGGEPLKVQTPFATIGIRGTRFWGGPLAGLGAGTRTETNPMTYETTTVPGEPEKGFGILLLEGRITVFNAAGGTDLLPDEGTAIPAPDAPPGAPKVWSPERQRRAFATVQFRE